MAAKASSAIGPGVLEVFAWFAIEAVPTIYTIGTVQGSGQQVGELIVTGAGSMSAIGRKRTV